MFQTITYNPIIGNSMMANAHHYVENEEKKFFFKQAMYCQAHEKPGNNRIEMYETVGCFSSFFITDHCETVKTSVLRNSRYVCNSLRKDGEYGNPRTNKAHDESKDKIHWFLLSKLIP